MVVAVVVVVLLLLPYLLLSLGPGSCSRHYDSGWWWWCVCSVGRRCGVVVFGIGVVMGFSHLDTVDFEMEFVVSCLLGIANSGVTEELLPRSEIGCAGD